MQTTNTFHVCILPDHIVKYVGLHSLSQRSQSRPDHLEVWPVRGREHITRDEKLEVVNKQVGGYLIPYNLQPPCVRKLEVIGPNARTLPRRFLWMMNHEWLSQCSQSVTYEGNELAGHFVVRTLSWTNIDIKHNAQNPKLFNHELKYLNTHPKTMLNKKVLHLKSIGIFANENIVNAIDALWRGGRQTKFITSAFYRSACTLQ